MNKKEIDPNSEEFIRLQRWAHGTMHKALRALGRIEDGENVPPTFNCDACNLTFYTQDVLAEMYRRSPKGARATWSGQYKDQSKVTKIFNTEDLRAWYSYLVNTLPQTFSNDDFSGMGCVHEHIFGFTLGYFRFGSNVFEFMVPRNVVEVAEAYARQRGFFLEVHAEDVIGAKTRNKPQRVGRNVEILNEKRQEIRDMDTWYEG